MKLKVDGKDYEVDVDPDTPLLWVLRDQLGKKGPKFGCGMAQCGACTVHLDGNAIRSCVMPAAAVSGEVTTIEGLAEGDELHPVQQAWLAEQVAQCGYCQGGQMMSAASLLRQKPKPTDADIDAAMAGNLCRCGTYPRIRKAVHKASELLKKGDS